MALIAPSAQAAPTLVGNARNVYTVGIDGNNFYWTDGLQITRLDIATGASSVIFRAGSHTQVIEIEAGGGTLAYVTVKSSKTRATTRASIYSAAGNQTRTAATAIAKIFGHQPACGSSIEAGEVTDGGEALLIRDTFSLNKKKCHKPLSLKSNVTAESPAASRFLFAGSYANGNPLQKLGLIFNADLSGSSLLLSGTAVGTLDLAGGQFTLLTPERRNTIAIGQFDRFGNVLQTLLKGSKPLGTTSLLNAESGFTTATPVEANAQGVVYAPCGDYLLRSKYDLKSGQTSGISATPNPLNASGLVPTNPWPASTQSLFSSSCDATNAAFAVSNPSGSGQLLYVSALAG